MTTVEYYNDLAPGYDELYGEEQLNKAYKILGRLQLSKTTTLLDIGCGTAIYAKLFPCPYVGIDPSSALVKIAQQRMPGHDIRVGVSEHLPYQTASFDIIISLTALHHANPSRAMREIRRVIKPRNPFSDELRAVITIPKYAGNKKWFELVLREQFVDWQITSEEDDKDIYFYIA